MVTELLGTTFGTNVEKQVMHRTNKASEGGRCERAYSMVVVNCLRKFATLK